LGDSQRAAAIDVTISAADARWLARFEDSNVNLLIHKCKAPNDHYPAFAFFNGKMIDGGSLPKLAQAERPVVLTFFLPERVGQRGAYDCATLDARGMASPVFFRSPPQRLPKRLRFQAPGHPLANGS
jgi:hypothetical protein